MINFNSVVADMICKPVINGHVMYTRIDGTYDDGGDKTITLSDEYKKKAKGKDNSPDNMRRLFITYKGVYTQYHRGLGGSDTNLVHERSYDEKIGDMEYRNFLANKVGLNSITANSVSNLHAQNPDQANTKFEKLKGSGLGALVKPWVMQNIEEIYIDWLPFSNYTKGGAGSANEIERDTVKAIEYILKEELCDGDLKKLSIRFPRLHTIGYLPSLAGMYSQYKGLVAQDSDMDKRVKSWIELVIAEQGKELPRQRAIKLGNGIIYRLKPNNAWMLEYSCKEGLYKFDADVLKGHFESLSSKYMEKYSTNIDKTSLDEKEVNYTELEKKVMQLESLMGLSSAANLLITELANKLIKMSDIQAFSEENKIKYMTEIEKYSKKKA